MPKRSNAPRGTLRGLAFKDLKDAIVGVFERHYVQSILSRNGGNLSHAATEAGINRKYLRELLEEHGIRPDESIPSVPREEGPLFYFTLEDFQTFVAQVQREYLRAVLKRNGGNVAKAAREAAVSRDVFYSRFDFESVDGGRHSSDDDLHVL